MTDPHNAVTLTSGSKILLLTVAVLGLLGFCWPLFLDPKSVLADPTGQSATPFVMGVVMLAVLTLVISELSSNDLDVKALAMLGVLAAVGAVLRPLGPGTAGIETVFFLLIVAGRVFGPGFGFLLGNLTLFASALITAGVGTWLPYQMIAAGFVGMLAGCLPSRLEPGGRVELGMLAGYGFLSAFAYGYLMDFAFWPFTFGMGGMAAQVGFDPEATPWHNVQTFLVVNTVTSLGWNLGRAISNVVLIVLLGRPLLRILRRTARRAVFS